MRTVHSDPDILAHAIVDGINIYVRDVLIPRGLIDPERYFGDSSLVQLEHRIAEQVAAAWRTSQVDRDV
jgi:hypothetical protein